MANFTCIRARKRKGATIKAMAQHNFRDGHREVKNADRSLTKENVHLSTYRTSEEALEAVKTRLNGCKRRKDSVEVIEYMVMASPEQFLKGGNLAVDRGLAFFKETYQWLERQHGSENVVWGTVQYDESTPHLSVGVVPRVETPSGPKLAANTWLNGRKALSELQDRVSEIGEAYGLKRGLRGSPAKHESVRRWYGALNMTEQDPRLQPMKLMEVPRAPSLMDRLTGNSAEKEKALERAEAHNRVAMTHNRQRMQLLAQMAGQGFGRRQSQKERAKLDQEAKQAQDEARKAHQQVELAAREKRSAGVLARQRGESIQALKAELMNQKENLTKFAQAAKTFAQELIKAAPERAREIGLIKSEPERQKKPEHTRGIER